MEALMRLWTKLSAVPMVQLLSGADLARQASDRPVDSQHSAWYYLTADTIYETCVEVMPAGQWSDSLRGIFGETNQSELAAFTSYALAFPTNFLALVDTYDLLALNNYQLSIDMFLDRASLMHSPDSLLKESVRGIYPLKIDMSILLEAINYHYTVVKADEASHRERGSRPITSLYKATGIRLDSGDLAYLSIEARKFFCKIEKEFGVVDFGKIKITASNDLNEETLDHLNKQGHEVDAFGIGTYLVTCYAQAALGCVFKLVEINNQPRMKLSEDVTKVSIPCKKRCYRLYGKECFPLVDIMTGENEPPLKVAERILCRHPFNESKRAYVVPQRVEELLKCYWAGGSGKVREPLPSLKEIRDRCMQQMDLMRPDHMRRLNPTPYKVVDLLCELYI
ncbi:Nicotinate phosphoribosyltransferase 2 [Asimina triloba]